MYVSLCPSFSYHLSALGTWFWLLVKCTHPPARYSRDLLPSYGSPWSPAFSTSAVLTSIPSRALRTSHTISSRWFQSHCPVCVKWKGAVCGTWGSGEGSFWRALGTAQSGSHSGASLLSWGGPDQALFCQLLCSSNTTELSQGLFAFMLAPAHLKGSISHGTVFSVPYLRMPLKCRWRIPDSARFLESGSTNKDSRS